MSHAKGELLPVSPLIVLFLKWSGSIQELCLLIMCDLRGRKG